MAFTKTPSYLWANRTGLWHAKLPIDPDVRRFYPTAAGDPVKGPFKTHLVKSLGTHQRSQAERLKSSVVLAWLQEFDRFRGNGKSLQMVLESPQLQESKAQLAQLREHFRDADPTDLDGRLAMEDSAVVHAERLEAGLKDSGAAEDEALSAARQAYHLTTNPGSLTLREALTGRHQVVSITEQTKALEELALAELLSFLKVDDCTPDYVTHQRAASYIDHLNERAMSHATRKGRLSCLSRLWSLKRLRTALGAKHKDLQSVWNGHELAGARKSTDEVGDDQSSAWTEVELVRMFVEPDLQDQRQRTYTRTLFRELHVVGVLTGMRLDEITALRAKDVAAYAEGVVVSVRKGKNENAIRVIPVLHPAAVGILSARAAAAALDGDTERLFAECEPGGKDKKTSHHVSKAMGRERDRLGFGPSRNFHSTRKTFSGLMDAAKAGGVVGLDEALIDAYFGHAQQTLRRATYSPGLALETFRVVAEAVHCGAELEALFKATADACRARLGVDRV